MTFQRSPKFLVIDDFLPASLVADLLDHALACSGDFEPTRVIREGESQLDSEARLSSQCEQGLGPCKAAYKSAIHARFDEFVAALGMQPFAIDKTELQLIAHGDGAFYKPHIDTQTAIDGLGATNYRAISAVYYFHQEPRQFSGGEIAIHPFGGAGPAESIEPRQNRLVVFPSIARHEVCKVSCPSGEFAHSRFAINCWLRKSKA